MAHGVFEQHQLTHNEHVLEVPAIINCLLTIYTEIQQLCPELINIPLCVDLCLNWLLNVYDRYVYFTVTIILSTKFIKTQFIPIMTCVC